MAANRIERKMQEYKEIKEKHPDSLLLFRVGDFYESYDVDASVLAAVLGITLTKKEDYNLAGFPSHALDTYLPKLIKAGKKVAIMDRKDKPAPKEDEATTLRKEMIKREDEHQKDLLTLCTEIIKLGNIPDNLQVLLYEYIGEIEVIRIKVENKIHPSLEEVQYLLNELKQKF